MSEAASLIMAQSWPWGCQIAVKKTTTLFVSIHTFLNELQTHVKLVCEAMFQGFSVLQRKSPTLKIRIQDGEKKLFFEKYFPFLEKKLSILKIINKKSISKV